MKTWICVWTLGVVALCGSLVWAADKPEDHSGQDRTGASFIKKQLQKANFEEAVLVDADFSEAEAPGANFQGADLTRTEFRRADLTGADFRGAMLKETRFFQTILNEANLEKADFSSITLSGAKFKKANLRKLKGIASVAYVDFSGADLRGANLVGMTIYNNTAEFRKAKYDSQTRWPKGFDVEASGAVLDEEEEKDEKPAQPEKDEPKKPGKNPADKKLEQEFVDLDANEDGRLSGKELRGLEAFDKNKDGRVTLEEFVAGRQKE